MKRNQTLLTALLACVMLVGCASNAAAPNEETAPVLIPETIAAVPETTAPAIVTEATEATETEAPFEVTITSVITEAQNSVTVTTADEFLAALASNTEIIVDAPLIDWSTATGYGTTGGEHYRWEDPTQEDIIENIISILEESDEFN